MPSRRQLVTYLVTAHPFALPGCGEAPLGPPEPELRVEVTGPVLTWVNEEADAQARAVFRHLGLPEPTVAPAGYDPPTGDRGGCAGQRLRPGSIFPKLSFTSSRTVTCSSPEPIDIDARTDHKAVVGLNFDQALSYAFDSGCDGGPI